MSKYHLTPPDLPSIVQELQALRTSLAKFKHVAPVVVTLLLPLLRLCQLLAIVELMGAAKIFHTLVPRAKNQHQCIRI
jgi:hypothetical protein